MHVNKSILTLSFVLLSTTTFAQSVDISTFNKLSTELQKGSSQANPINITNNINFSGNISFNTDNYLNDNNYIFNGGSELDANPAPRSSGVSGFVTSGGTQVFNNVRMYNFTSQYYGAAINNAGADVTINNSDFYYNSIYNFSASEAFNYGGALDNFGGTMNINNSNFYNNLAGGGAAISNIGGTVTIKNSVFKNNTATRDAANNAEGGAIANYADMYVYDSLFENNKATHGGSTKNAYGGAIFNAQYENLYIYNNTFINNSADDKGGAIFNDWYLYVYAQDANTVFSGNTDSTGSNAIHNTCLVNLYANEKGKIIFNDAITSTASAPMNIGDTGFDGDVVLNADMRGVLGKNTLKNGSLIIGSDIGVDANGFINMFGSGMEVNTVGGGKSYINMQNNNFDSYKTGSNLSLTTDLYAKIDVDLEKQTADKFVDLSAAGGSGRVVIEGIDIKADINANNLPIEVSKNGADKILLSNDAKIITTPIHTYSVSDANLATDGTLVFNVEGYHNSILASGASKKAHSMLLTDITKHVLTPNASQTPVGALASGDENPFSSFWIDTKVLSEDVNLKEISVNNDTYIAIAGLDIKGESFDNWSKIYSLYAGYVGSRQKYEGVKTTQDGFAAGAGIRFEKDSFFTAFTTNFITSFVDGNNEFGNENFNIYSTSIANKTGMHYGFEDNKFVLKPSVIVGYHFVHTEDYTNAADVKIKADDLHIFHISPELKFVTNFDNGFSPYVAAAYHWNIENGGDTTANDLLLPSLAVDNYAEFAIGFGKNFSNNLHTYAEVILTSGDRTGGGAHVGLKLEF